MQNYVQPGNVLDYVNGTDAAITGGSVVALADSIGVAVSDIYPGAKGALNVTGVYNLPKAAEGITQGTRVYFDKTAGKLTATVSTNVPAGIAWTTAASGDSSINVKINV
jgi:predicted RecA/RadA family phage recombinase